MANETSKGTETMLQVDKIMWQSQSRTESRNWAADDRTKGMQDEEICGRKVFHWQL